MRKKAQETTFKFILTNQQLFSNLDHLKLNDYERFIRVGELGKQIQQAAKADDHEAIQSICDDSFFDIQYMRMEIEDAFVSALHLRNEPTVEFFLRHGIDLDTLEPGCVLQLCYSLEYLRHDPPTSLLKLLLEYGGNPRYASSDESDTGLHVAARYGNVEFLQLLLDYGADINGANNQRKTPLGEAVAAKNKAAINFLQSRNASEKWNA